MEPSNSNLTVSAASNLSLMADSPSTPSVHTASASQTEIRVENIKHSWKVLNFSHCYAEYLENFVHLPRGEETLSWSIKIYPKGNGENNKDFVFLCLNRVISCSPKNKVGFRSKFVLRNNEGKEIEMRVHPSPSHSDYVSYLKRDVLFPLISPADSITVFVEIDVAVETVTTTSDEQYVPRLRCNCERLLSSDYLRLLQDSGHSDFVIRVEGGSSSNDIPVHKAILSARSPVLAAMLTHNDTDEVKTGVMKIGDVEYAVVLEMLRYIYSGRCSSDMPDMCSELLIAADKYGLEELKNDCERLLIQNLASDNVCTLLVISDLYNAEKLRQRAVKYILERPKDITGTSGWELILREHAHLVTDIVRNFDKTRSGGAASSEQCALLNMLSSSSQ